jgi:hypothetical protein
MGNMEQGCRCELGQSEAPSHEQGSPPCNGVQQQAILNRLWPDAGAFSGQTYRVFGKYLSESGSDYSSEAKLISG